MSNNSSSRLSWTCWWSQWMDILTILTNPKLNLFFVKGTLWFPQNPWTPPRLRRPTNHWHAQVAGSRQLSKYRLGMGIRSKRMTKSWSRMACWDMAGGVVFFQDLYIPPPKKRNMLISIENVQFLLAWIWIASFLWWEVYFGMQWLIRQLCHVKELLDESVPHKVLNTRTTYPLHLVVSKTSWIWLAKNWPPTNTPCKDPIWTDGSSSILPRKDWGRRPICWLEDWVCTPWNLP